MTTDNKKPSGREIVGGMLKFLSGTLLIAVVLLGGCGVEIIFDSEMYPNLPWIFLLVVIILIGLFVLGSKFDHD